MKIDSYRNAVVMVTGAASGFGRLLAERLNGCGARLVLGDINDQGLCQTGELLRAGKVRPILQSCDVRKEADVASLVERAVSEFGRIDVAINNAGVLGTLRRLINIDEQQMDDLFAINTKGVFFGMKHQIRQMLKQKEGGRILNVSSILGVGGAPGGAAYSASKHAVIGLTRTAALEYGGANVRVNAICPFFSKTPMLHELTGYDPALERAAVALSPMNRPAKAEEIVDVMLMICAAENSFMNGQAIVVDGGMSAA